MSADGKVMGSYLHGLFVSDTFRRAFLANLGIAATRQSYASTVDDALDSLADHCERHLDVEGLLAIAR
jgi:adenosylcobyric acid synthase